MTKETQTQDKEELEKEEFSQKILMRQMREEARKEQIQLFIAKNRNSIISVLVILAIIALGFGYYHSFEQDKSEKYSKLLHEAVILEDSGQKSQAFDIFKDISENKSAPIYIKSLAGIKYGSFLFEQNKLEEAVEIYLKVNQTSSNDQYLKELSGLLALKSMIDSGKSSFKDKIENLIPELEKSSAVLKPLILEQKAIFYWLQNQPEEAKKIFENLTLEVGSSQSLKNRSKEFIKIIENK